MKYRYAPLLLAVLALSWTPAQAERADRDKPMNIESDNLRYDDQKQISIFTGGVALTKGTIVMRGARLEVRQDPLGNQFGLLTAEAGKRAFFRQKREGFDEFMEGEAERIEYDSKADTVKFFRNAELRRFRGATLNDEITGSLVVYDNKTETFTVDGVAGPSGGGRVRAMLTPRPSASAVAAGRDAPAPARSTASQAVPSLRSSTTMGGDRK